MGRTPIDSDWTCPDDKYSLYTLKPELPAMSAFPIDGIRYRARDNAVLNQVHQVMADGPAAATLHEIIRREHRVTRKRESMRSYRQTRSMAAKQKLDEEQEVLQQQSAEDDAGDEFTDRSAVRRRVKRARRRSRSPELEMPEVPLPDVIRPASMSNPELRSPYTMLTSLLQQVFPLEYDHLELMQSQSLLANLFLHQDLLTAVHLHTSRHLSNSFNLLPALSDSTPRMPEEVIAHFDAINAQHALEEQAAVRNKPTRVTLEQIRSQWVVNRTNKGKSVSQVRLVGRKNCWKNADRAFDASALVALCKLRSGVRGSDPPIER